jgi:hypothetical protein
VTDPLFKAEDAVLSRNRWILAFIVHGLRAVMYAGLWTWNADIRTGIIPALHCWYCQPANAPYGILWYALSFPGSFLGATGFIAYTAVVDQIVMMYLRNYRRLYWTYLICSFWIWLQAPYDLPILWIASFGMLRAKRGTWPLTFLAVLAKLPFGAPASVWNTNFTRHYLWSDYQYYALTGIVIVAFLVQSVLIWRRGSSTGYG